MGVELGSGTDRYDAWALLGPTASGKTDLALALAEHGPVDIVNMDSAQVYRGMDIGTAKTDLAVRQRIPHHLVDIIDPAEAYSAGRFVEEAQSVIRSIRRAGRIPLLVGGTWLYYRALREGLAPLPPATPGVREKLAVRATHLGWPSLHAELARIDPAAGQRIHPHDAQRIQRALEVWELTGIPLSVHWARARHPGLALRTLVLMPAHRDWLHRRIAQRLEAMFAAGFVEEVAGLRARSDLHPDLPALRAVGYRQVWTCLDGRLPRDRLFQSVLEATRQYAKRQITAMRPLTAVDVLDPADETARTRAVTDFQRSFESVDKRM